MKLINKYSFKTFCLLINMLFVNNIKANEFLNNSDSVTFKESILKLDIGIGAGYDYGGLIGCKYTYYPFKFGGLFFAIGYIEKSAGYNFGTKFLALPVNTLNNIRPFVKLMYGTNSQIESNNKYNYFKAYSGYTYGIGFEVRFGKFKLAGFNFDLSYRNFSRKFKNHYNYLTENNMMYERKYNKFSFSFGLHFSV